MNAHELTIIVNKQSNEIIDLKKEISFLNQEVKMIRLLLSDLQIDVKMLGGAR